MLAVRVFAPLAIVAGGIFGLSALVSGELTQGAVLGVGEERATVLSVRTTDMDSGFNRYGIERRTRVRTGLFELEDGEEVRLFVPMSGLRQGDVVTLRVTHYDDGSRQYGFPREQ
jgi:hypothetical protein